MTQSVGLDLPDYTFGSRVPVLIIGAGLAGCAIARALSKRGYHCKLYDQNSDVAAAASALPVAVIRPAISGDTRVTDYFNKAFSLCCDTLDDDHYTRCGALELTDKPPAMAIDRLEFVSDQQASALAGKTLNRCALYHRQAGYTFPKQLCERWTDSSAVEFYPDTLVDTLRHTDDGWALLGSDGGVIDESPLLVIATAGSTPAFAPLSQLPLQQTCGQIDRFENTGSPLNCVVNGGSYLVPDANAVWCGATHHRPPEHTALQVTPADSAANRAQASAMMPDLTLAPAPTHSFYQARAHTPDRLPIVGAVHDQRACQTDYADLRHGKPASHFPPASFHKGLYVATGLGSRGATQALLIGELMAGLISGQDVDQHTLQMLHPARFQLRALRRGL